MLARNRDRFGCRTSSKCGVRQLAAAVLAADHSARVTKNSGSKLRQSTGTGAHFKLRRYLGSQSLASDAANAASQSSANLGTSNNTDVSRMASSACLCCCSSGRDWARPAAIAT
jgi:hypothetical protein